MIEIIFFADSDRFIKQDASIVKIMLYEDHRIIYNLLSILPIINTDMNL